MGEFFPTRDLVIKDREWEGYSLWKYIKLLYPYYTKLLVIKELRLKKILVNSSTSYFQYKLSIGDVISITVLPERARPRIKKSVSIKKEEIEKFKRDQILFENEHLIIVYKYPGQLIQPDSSIKAISLSEILGAYSKNDSNYTYKFVHRLDRPVSGLIIGAKNTKAHNLLSESLKQRSIFKLYQAILLGNCSFNSKVLTHWIKEKGVKVAIQQDYTPGAKYSESKITKLANFSNLSLVELKLVTGRKNQLRAQLAHISHPILGDRKYYSEEIKKTLKIDNHLNNLKFNPNKIALTAYKIGFPPLLVRELNLPWTNFTLPKDKNIILKSLKKF